MKGDEEKIRAGGCEDYLSKPIAVSNSSRPLTFPRALGSELINSMGYALAKKAIRLGKSEAGSHAYRRAFCRRPAGFFAAPGGFAQESQRRRCLRSPYVKYGFARLLAFGFLVQTEPHAIYEFRPLNSHKAHGLISGAIARKSALFIPLGNWETIMRLLRPFLTLFLLVFFLRADACRLCANNFAASAIRAGPRQQSDRHRRR